VMELVEVEEVAASVGGGVGVEEERSIKRAIDRWRCARDDCESEQRAK